MFEDDEFDFGGGDENEDVKTPAGKRNYGDIEDDDEELFPPKKMYGTSLGGGVDHATTTIINLRASLEERDSKISSLQSQVEMANLEVDKWRRAFQNESILLSGAIIDPESVLQVLKKLESSEGKLKEQLLVAKRREAAIFVKLANKEQDVADLKAAVHDLKLMMKPPAVQARRLLLDPAIHAEFTRMKKELENAEKKVKDLQDDLAAVQFTPHSKNGKMLMAKCRTLQEENEEIGREASEGKIRELATNLAMQKSLNAELRRGYQEMYDYVEELNEESERSRELVDILKRQIEQKDEQVLELQKRKAIIEPKIENTDTMDAESEEETNRVVEGAENEEVVNTDSRR